MLTPDKTHNVTMASPFADFVVALGVDGRITSQGSIANALEHDSKLAAEVAKEQADIEKAEETVDEQVPAEEPPKPDAGKLVVEEEIAVGHVGLQASTPDPAMGLGFALNRRCTYSETLLQGARREPPSDILVELYWWSDCLRVLYRPPNLVPWLLGSAIRGDACVRRQRIIVRVSKSSWDSIG